MLTDKEIQALFADASDSDSHKKKNPKPKISTEKKSRSTKKKAKISFDPDIFLDGVTNESNEKEDTFNTPITFFSKSEEVSFPPELSNLVGRITFYLNSQLHYLMDDLTNELILLVDTTPKEKEIVDIFLNEILDSIKKLFSISDENSYQISNPFTPESFDIYADRFHQSFLEAEKYSQTSYDTIKIKSLRKDINNTYNKIKNDFQEFPHLLQTEINDLTMAYNNYNSILNTRRMQDKSQKNREIALNCKKIEQKIFYDHFSKRIDHVKDEKAKYSQFLEINEVNKLITTDKISDAIFSLKESINNEKQSSSDQLFKQEDGIKKLKNNLKLLRAQYQYQHQNQITIAYSSIQDEGNSQKIPNSFINQRNSLTSMNLDNSNYINQDSSMIQQSANSLSTKSHRKSSNRNDSFSKIQKSFNSLLSEQNRNLENTSDFIKSVKTNELSNLMHRSYYE